MSLASQGSNAIPMACDHAINSEYVRRSDDHSSWYQSQMYFSASGIGGMSFS
jgi:hypothetical protein